MQPLLWETVFLVFLLVCMCGPQRPFLTRNTAGNIETHLLCLTGGDPETWSWLVLPKELRRAKWEDYHLHHPAWCVHRPFLLHWAMLVTGVGLALVVIDYAVRQGCESPWLVVSEGTGKSIQKKCHQHIRQCEAVFCLRCFR